MTPRTAATARVPPFPGRPAQAQVLVANLHVKGGSDGQQPSAHYECFRCGFRTKTVVGQRAVAEFTATATEGAEAHRASCPALQETTQ